MSLSTLPLDGSCFADGFELAFQARDSFLDPATIDFELGFPRSTRSNPTRLA
jgi:hypothetical protein